jgi:hypothetical protein
MNLWTSLQSLFDLDSFSSTTADQPIVSSKDAYHSARHSLGYSRFILGLLFFYAAFEKTCAANLDLSALSTEGLSITGSGSGDQTGYSLSSAGDVDGDGIPDQLVSAYSHASNVGVVYLIRFGTNVTNINLANPDSRVTTITGAGAGCQTGYSVSSAGDVDGSGKPAILIGSPGCSVNTGRADLIRFGNNFANVNLAISDSRVTTITGTGAGSQTGYSIKSAGDVEGSGKAAILIGAPGYSSNTGIAYLIRFGNNFANVNLATSDSRVTTIKGGGWLSNR